MIRSIIAACFLLSSAAFADVSITWGTPVAPDIDQFDGTDAPSGWIAQLMFTRDGNIAPPNPSAPYGDVLDDEVLHQQQLNTFGVPGFLIHVDDSDGNAGDGKQSDLDSYAGGFVYTRVFNVDFVDTGTTLPTLYGVSTLSTALQTETSDPTTVTPHEPVVIVNLPIPEPSTYVLMGFGALLLFLRIRREKS